MITIERLNARPKGGDYAKPVRTTAMKAKRVKSAEEGPRFVTDMAKRKRLASFTLMLGLRDSNNPSRSGIAINEQFIAVLDVGLASRRQSTLDAVLPVASCPARSASGHPPLLNAEAREKNYGPGGQEERKAKAPSGHF